MKINGILHDIKKTVPKEKLEKSSYISAFLNEKPYNGHVHSKFFEES